MKCLWCDSIATYWSESEMADGKEYACEDHVPNNQWQPLIKPLTLEQEILELTKQWMDYVSQDHHKDRDCHWYVTKVYSYGEEPYYEAHHAGYILDSWTSPRCGTEEMALTLLRDKLKKAFI